MAILAGPFSSVAQLYLILCDPMDGSMLGFPVHHQLPELTQIHVHRVSDATQPSHPSIRRKTKAGDPHKRRYICSDPSLSLAHTLCHHLLLSLLWGEFSFPVRQIWGKEHVKKQRMVQQD